MTEYVIILFYKFVRIENPAEFAATQKELCKRVGVKGRMLVAHEGINGTFEGTRVQIDEYVEALRSDERFSDLKVKESEGTGKAFTKIQIRVRDEVVTLGAGEFDITKETAYEMPAEELEALYASGEDFVVLDLRNGYEIEVGAFDKTVNPNLKNFRDLPAKLKELGHLKNKKVVAVCTGGIRCEKATCLLKREGFTDVAQLKDGIHTYMQKYPVRHFKGSLFVFDNRMTTPVVDAPNREVIGKCVFCGGLSEDYYSDDSVRPTHKLICCESCIGSRKEVLRSCEN